MLDILVPILYYLNDARADQCESPSARLTLFCPFPSHVPHVSPSAAARVGLMHIGVFILLLLSGERNFGVRLNKPYSIHVPMDIPVFTGTHADLLIVVRPLLHYITPNANVLYCCLSHCSQLPLCLFCRCFTRLSPQATNVFSLCSTACSPLLLMVVTDFIYTHTTLKYCC